MGHIKEKVLELYKKNTRKRGEHTFTLPACSDYQAQFAWDSGFHAVVWLYLAAGRAREELAALFACQLDNGMVPHEVPLAGTDYTWRRRLILFLLHHIFSGEGYSRIIDPPVFVTAVKEVYRKTGDKPFIEDLLPALENLFVYLEMRRPPESNLVAIVHPLEAGTDASPMFDEALGLRRGWSTIERFCRLYQLGRSLTRIGWENRQLLVKSPFLVFDPGFNSIYIKALGDMGYLCRELSKEERANHYFGIMKKATAELEDRLWDRQFRCYNGYDLRRGQRLRRRTLACLLPLFTGSIERERALAMIERYLTPGSGFWTPFPLSFNLPAELDARESRKIRDLWRGPCVWMNMNWMLYRGLNNYGQRELAAKIARASYRLVTDGGFWEYYNAYTGAGQGAHGFTWGGLVLAMM